MTAALSSLVPPPGGAVDAALALSLVPKLAPLAITPQDSVYHAEGDVWTHTQMVCQELTRLQAYQEADPTSRFVLFFAALLHDLSKPACTVLEPDGTISSKGHSALGAIDARKVLWQAGVPFEVRERICAIISTHQVPFFAMGHDRRGRRPEFIVHTLSWDGRVADLCAVAEADMRGRVSIHQAKALDDMAVFELLTREERCWDRPKAFPDPHTRLQYVRSLGSIPLEAPFHQPTGSRVTVLAGLPAAGKDTWAARHGNGRAVLSFDDAKASLNIKPGQTAGAAVHLVYDQAKRLLREQAPFIWNATHLTPLMRSKTLDLLFRYQAEVEIVYLEVPYQELMERNGKRNSTLSNKKLELMLRHWTIPSVTEAHNVRFHGTVLPLCPTRQTGRRLNN